MQEMVKRIVKLMGYKMDPVFVQKDDVLRSFVQKRGKKNEKNKEKRKHGPKNAYASMNPEAENRQINPCKVEDIHQFQLGHVVMMPECIGKLVQKRKCIGTRL